MDYLRRTTAAHKPNNAATATSETTSIEPICLL